MTAKELQASVLAQTSQISKKEHGAILDRIVLRIWEDPAITSYLSGIKVDDDLDTVAIEFFELPRAVVSSLVSSIGGDAKAYSYASPESGAPINAIKFKLSSISGKEPQA